MEKPKIFISHIKEEADIAIALKEFIERKFLKSLQIFVSAHEESIKLGDDWINSIKASLEQSKLIIVLCSPISIHRPWINFEAGAGWLRNIPIIPICHSGSTPSDLPKPLNSFQGGLLNNQDDIRKLFKRIAGILEIDVPDYNDDDFIEAINNFEGKILNSILSKDTQFLYNFFYRQIELLKYCIYGSTYEINDNELKNVFDRNIADYSFDFNSIHNLFNPCALTITDPMKPMYKLLNETIKEIQDNIKFVLSYNRIEISPTLNELMHMFLFSVIKASDWYFGVELTERSKNNDMKELMLDMIKKEPSPPERRKHSNLIHPFIDYYESLLFYKNWIIEFEKETKRILSK